MNNKKIEINVCFNGLDDMFEIVESVVSPYNSESDVCSSISASDML